jgi:UDP-N-acetyl-D-glucosamine dehydrogenase
MNHFNQLKTKIENKDLVVGILGIGYIGLPLLLRFGEEKIKTIGFDIDERKINLLSEQQSFLKHISKEQIEFVKDYIKVTNDFSLVNKCDALIICVPTPLNKNREPNLDYIVNAMEMILPHTKEGQLISLESTTYPGTTEEIIQTSVEKNGFKVGENIFVTYSPEREDPGRTDYNTKNTPKVCAGITKQCLALGQSLYELIVDKVVPVSSTKTAEMTKLLENIHRAVNISLINEMKIIADKMGIDIHEVIAAASTKPFGFVPYQPGPGPGGHCIPVDPFYLTWKAKEYGHHSYFIELAGEINSNMPQFVVKKLVTALNERKIPANGTNVLILGIAYKKNVDDMRESPSLVIMDLLREKNVNVDFSDPHISAITDKESIALTKENLERYDAVILATDHDQFDYSMILENCKLIIDTRGRFPTCEKVVKA